MFPGSFFACSLRRTFPGMPFIRTCQGTSSGNVGPTSARILWVRLVKILNQQDFIPLLVVEQIIHKFLRHQNTIAARAYALGFPLRNVAKRFIRRIGESAMFELFKRKTSAWVSHFAKDRT